MRISLNPGVLALLTVFALAIAMLFTSLVHADAPTLVDRLVAVQPGLQSKRDEPVDPLELAQAIADVSKGNREWSALLLTVAASESALSEKVRLGQYRDLEGDSYIDKDGTRKHRAWGLLQVHENSLNASVFGSTDLHDQVREGSRLARGAFYMCKRAGVPFPLGVFRALGHGNCSAPLKGEEKRVAMFNRVKGKL